MKITGITPLVCHCYRTNWVFVKVTTDEGLHGVGEATLEYREPTLVECIREHDRVLRGRDPFEIEAIWHECYRDTYFRGGPVNMSALSGLEMALWDLKGKALGVPCYELLGGRVRDRVPCYANGWFSPAKEPAEFAEKAKAAVARGFTGLKWDPFGKSYLNISKADLRQAMRCIEAVVEAVGDQVEILVEAHGRFNVATAVRIGRELENFDITWYEEPVPP
jgi:galactonate dehydratase